MALYQLLEEEGFDSPQLAVNIIDYADRDDITTFLEIADGVDTKIVRGVESVRINEVMVKPVYQYEADIFDGYEGTGGVPWDDVSPDDTYIACSTQSATTDTPLITLERDGYYNVRLLTYDDTSNRSFGVRIYDGGDTVLEDTVASLGNTIQMPSPGF